MRRVLLATLLLSGCDDNKQCEAFANHLAEVLGANAAQPVSEETKAKMIKKTTESCIADPPSKASLDCALKAQTADAIKACDKVE